MADQDRLKEHAFDGIAEYDNDLPRWWLALLWLTVIWAAGYVCWHMGGAELGPAALRAEVQAIAAAKVNDASGPLPEDALRVLSHDAARVHHGAKLYASSQCATCHGPEAKGLVGPNLRDDYWIYGSDMATLVETITGGRLNGVMPPQGKNLSRDEIIDLAAYIADTNRSAKADGKPADKSREKVQRIEY